MAMCKRSSRMNRTGFVQVVSIVLALNASAAVRYVNLNSANPASPYLTWATAATNIQVAIDVSTAGDEIVVTNGVYGTGARIASFGSNRVAVTKPVTVRSVNGPAVTVIRGHQVPGTVLGLSAVRCAYLTNGAALIGFTLTNGAAIAAQINLRNPRRFIVNPFIQSLPDYTPLA